MPSSSRAKRPADSTPATEWVIVLDWVGVGDSGPFNNGVSEKTVDVAGEGEADGAGSECALRKLLGVLSYGGVVGEYTGEASGDEGSGDVIIGIEEPLELMSEKAMRRSMITLALLIVTAGSNGCKVMGIDTRSCGPTGVDGTDIRYRTTGARGLSVCEPK